LGAKEILIIVNPRDLLAYKHILKSGEQWGINIQYLVQDSPKGIADAVNLSKEFIGTNAFMLLLGDNLFFGHNLIQKILGTKFNENELTLVTYNVKNPQDFGVAEYNNNNIIQKILEKPLKPPSNRAVTGMYFYPNIAVNLAENLTPSDRGELEITDLNNLLIKKVRVNDIQLGRGDVWFDTGNVDDLHAAASFIKSMENRSGRLIGSPDEISYRLGLVSRGQFEKNIKIVHKSSYGKMLEKIREEPYYEANE
jgi:glucose-1-phosphate thymidylyltransferase